MSKFIKLICSPAGLRDVTLAISACRAGGVGILNAELESDSGRILRELGYISQKVSGGYGLKLDAIDEVLSAGIRDHVHKGLCWLILDAGMVVSCEGLIAELRLAGVTVLAEIKTPHWLGQPFDHLVDGLVLKGNEAGGLVGEDSSFILVQKWRQQTGLPLYIHGGLTPHTAAACSAVGVAGGVLDSQLLLLEESSLPKTLRTLLGNLAGSETVAVGDGERGEYFRLLVRPGHTAAKAFVGNGEGQGFDALRCLVRDNVDWEGHQYGLLPIGQDVCFAGHWQKQYRCMAEVFKAFDAAIDSGLRQVVGARPIFQDAPMARALGVRFPLVQGPMTRVSDCAEFAMAVAEGGALPMVAFALMKGPALEKLLAETTRLLGDRHWGIGLLGFAPQALLDEQLAVATLFHPDYAIIAGGRPDQAVRLEKAGIPTFLHVPSANLLPLFIQEGARRFIFEGRECGGHIGPLSSFVLWSTMVDRLLAELASSKLPGSEIELLFAGGIHDAVSSAMLQVLVAPLVTKGVKVGILMGSAYLFTREIVSSGAIVAQFQKEVIDCQQTVNLESGPGHASRCAYTPFAKEFFRKRVQLREKNVPADEGRQTLDDLILGRLRIASKGSARKGKTGKLQELDADQQRREGMYMLGQVATLRAEVTDISLLHRQVTEDAAELLAARFAERVPSQPMPGKPVDIAIIGIASVLPKARTSQEYWENILAKVDAIGEIPSHRWDWRLYYDENRSTRDKIYSKWGGFLDDMIFDPTRYGITPKSIESVDPMQLMALEVAQQTLVDAGYQTRAFNRERASVIIGASGGAGDVGTQYGLRAELPRFHGTLPEAVANRLPEWTEDTFSGILINVIAGRIANRLNLGGVNFTTDAACASSLAAIYQGISELSSGRSDFVIAGGVDTVQGPFGYLCFSKTQALSPRGRCSSFDVSGDGIVISEGIAMVALKRLDDAERDGDRIYAVVKGVGGGSDGNARGLTAPLPAGQLRAMRRAYAQAGFGPDSIALFEAHGTGTVAGDTAELESTTSLIKEADSRPRQAAIGSVKTMIGHTKATAGIAGLIKATLALHHRVLPPHGAVNQPNQVLQQIDSPLYLVDEALPWIASPDVPRRAAVSAFGFGGTNFHVVLEEYTREYRKWLRPAATRRWPAELFLWSESDRDGLATRMAQLREELVSIQNVELRDLACSLASRWRTGSETVAIVAKDLEDLTAKIDAAVAYLRGVNNKLPADVHHGPGVRTEGKLAILFPGQGSQYTGMLRELALHFQVCADTLSEADGLLKEALEERFGKGVRLSHFIIPRGSYNEEARNAAKQALTSTDVAQPALGAVEASLLRLVQTFGLQPEMLAGHSYGEFVAHYAGGAIDFGTLMALSAARGRFIVDAAKSEGAELGTMAAVQAPRKDVEEAIADIDGVVVANHNAPLQCIISGSRSAIETAKTKLSKPGIHVSEIPVAAAFHSKLVMPAQRALGALIESTEWRDSVIPVYSNTTASRHTADVHETKRLMAEHLVCPVEFVAEIEAMYRDGARVFLELGPKSVMTRLTGKILEGRPHLALAVDEGNGMTGLLNAFGKLVCAGFNLDVVKLFEGRECAIADPTRLASLQRQAIVPKHAWLLNGSGVRRYGDPAKQIGVLAGDLSNQVSQQIHGSNGTSSTALSAMPKNDSVITTQTLFQKRSREESHMGERQPVPIAGDPAIMAEYFATMRQFLETQERVMSMFMGGEPLAGRAGVRQLRNARPSVQPRVSNFEPALAPTYAKQSEPLVASIKAVAEPQPQPAHVSPAPKSPTPVAPKSAHAAPKSEGKAEASLGMDRNKMSELLLGIVEDKTGYPRDMVGLDQNLESDLGIDSIKRVEVVGAMLQKLPEDYRQALGESRGRLNTQATLNGMLNVLGELKIGGTVAVPFDSAGVGAAAAVVSHPPRYIIVAKQEVAEATWLRQIKQGHFLVTEDGLGVASALTQMLIARGCSVSLIGRDVLGHEDLLAAWVAEQRSKVESVAGIVHLAPLGSAWLEVDAPLESWRDQLQINEKSLFILVRDFSEKLGDGSHVLSMSALGGFFSRRGSVARGLSLQGGAPGMLKSLFDERPTLRIKAVDVESAQHPTKTASILFAELELVGGRQEVGYPNGVRTVFHTVAASADPDKSREGDLQPAVVFATGGARGVTAEVLRELALPGNTLVLTGRNPLEEREHEVLAALSDVDALRQHFISAVRGGTSGLTPADIRRKVQSVLAAREMRSNIEDFRRCGATVEYHAVDVTNEVAMRQLLNDVYERHGKIDGVLHGAGVIEDKLLADKKSDSWSRVVETKVMGLLLLQKHLRPDSLKFLTVFSSVAGRYGNSGQSDYATANELMNRLCCQLRDSWGGRVNVMALCWGPWGPTKFGAGMVTAETEAKFAEKGVLLVAAGTGRQMLKDELNCGNNSDVEIICGEGPWEQREAANGEIRKNSQVSGQINSPLLGSVSVNALAKGAQVVPICLDANHAYLQQHCIDGIPVLPAAVALELMAEAARSLWDGWKVVEVRDCRLLKGVELKGPERLLFVTINPPPYGSSEGFEVNATLHSELENGKSFVHYRCVLRLEQQLPDEFEHLPQPHTGKKLAVTKAYDDWLFHGPCFRVIENIEGLSSAGARAQVRSTRPADWLLSVAPDQNRWLFDPALIDAAAQMAILWSRSFRDETPLPTRFGRVVRYRETLPDRLFMAFEHVASANPSVVCANVYFSDAAGRVLLLIEEMECIASAGLNRLGGSAKPATKILA